MEFYKNAAAPVVMLSYVFLLFGFPIDGVVPKHLFLKSDRCMFDGQLETN